MTKKKQKWFKREIIERFMTENDIKLFEHNYQYARLINLGRVSGEKKRYYLNDK